MKLSMYTSKIPDRVVMTDDDCSKISEIVSKFCGIKLGNAKKTMIQSRLDRRVIELGFGTYWQYLDYIKKNREEFDVLINALTTNKTEFLREKEHFDFLKKVIEKNSGFYSKKGFYVWSAASSTGEEAFTMAFLLEDIKRRLNPLPYRILGTDIDTKVIEKASKGIYPRDSLSVLAPDVIARYFEKGTGGHAGDYRVIDQIQKNIKFRKHNLISRNDVFKLKFDAVFLRNVLIYFEQKDIQIVINKIVDHLLVGGYLFIGHSESLNGIAHNLERVSGSVYQRIK